MKWKKISAILGPIMLVGILIYVVFFHTNDMALQFFDVVVSEIQEQTNEDVLKIQRAEYHCEKATNNNEVIYRCGFFVIYQAKSTNDLMFVSVRLVYLKHVDEAKPTLLYDTYSSPDAFIQVVRDYKRHVSQSALGPGTWQTKTSGSTITKELDQAFAQAIHS